MAVLALVEALRGHAPSGVAAVASLLLVYTVMVFLRRVLLDPLRDVPGPSWAKVTSLPVTRAAMAGRRVYKLEELHQEYGPIVRVGPNEVSVGDWRHLRTIYTNTKTVFKDPGFYQAATFVGKENVFNMINGVKHAARRKISSPPYSLQSVAKLAPIIQDRARVLASRLASGASSSPAGTADAYHLLGLFSLEIVCQVGFAKAFKDDEPDDVQGGGDALKLLSAMDGAAPTLIFDVILPFLRPLRLASSMPGAVGRAYRCHAYWTAKSREMVDHFLRNSTLDDKYLLTPLIKEEDGYLGRRLTHEELVEEVMNYMFAGSGTTSSTLTYLVYELARSGNASIQKRLWDEVTALAPDDIVALRSNPYVNAVIKETFRLHPTIISTIPRLLAAPLRLGKYTLKAGTVVGMQNWIHHRDPSVFPDPDEFIPDRWLQADEAMESSLTPFSIGRRGCIGQNLAWEEIYWVISAVMHAGLEFTLGHEMREGDMNKVDRFNIAPSGGRLMVHVRAHVAGS